MRTARYGSSRIVQRLIAQILEYTLFQPGLFLNYLAFPHKTSKFLTPLNTFLDFQNRRAIVVDGNDATMNLTTVQDLAAVVVEAVDFQGEWPIVGGIRGSQVKISQIIKIGEKIRGMTDTLEDVADMTRSLYRRSS
jgi:hypothetical protein